MRKTFVVTGLGLLLALAACNTVEGAGKDVSSAGDAVAKTADKAKN